MEIKIRFGKNHHQILILLFSCLEFVAISKGEHDASFAFNWMEISEEYNLNLTVAYYDDSVTFLSSSNINTSTQIPFSFVAKAWGFVQSIYSSTLFRENSRLYIIFLHQNQSQQRNKLIIFSNSTEYLNGTLNSRNIIECILNNNNDINYKTPCTFGSIIQRITNRIQDLVFHSEFNSTSKSTNLVDKWGVLDIIAYDYLIKAGDLNATQAFVNEVTTTTTTIFPQENVTLFEDWYLPIHTQHGGSQTVERFVSLLRSYRKHNTTFDEGKVGVISPGEFVHLWSEAAGSDLRHLAYNAFGWIPEYRQQFEEARSFFAPQNYSDIFPNNSMFLPQAHWMEHWINHDSNVTLVFFDGHVAIYFDDSISRNTTWIFKRTSEAWRFAKENYGPFGPDPVLHVVLHTGGKHECWRSKNTSLLDKEYENRNVIDCKQIKPKDWDGETLKNVHYLTEEVAIMSTHLMKETGNYPADSKMVDILVYEIYLGLGRTEEAEHWKEKKLEEMSDSPRKKTFWFKKWFYPIYINYGGRKALNDFANALYLYWPRKGTDYVGEMNLGEFVHFWSGVVGVDLRNMGIQAFGWSLRDDEKLAKARLEYPKLNYSISAEINVPKKWKEHWADHNELLSLVDSNEEVAFYTDSHFNVSIKESFELMTNAWKYAKQAYGPLSKDPILYVILHEESQSNCITSRRETYLDRDFDNRNVIDCYVSFLNFPTLNDADLLLTQVAYLVMTSSEQTGNWPGWNVTRWTMVNILVYDIYRGISHMEDANRWKNKNWGESENFPQPKTYWFRHWYYPLYEMYGGAQIYKNFFSILKRHWPSDDYDYIKNFDLGTMVHFWSGAVGENLWYLAAETFGWGVWNHKNFLKARLEYSEVTYNESYLDLPVTIPSEKWKEHWKQNSKRHEEELILVYVDAHVVVYYDSQMDLLETWLFKPLSDAWRYIKEAYGPVGSDPFLYVVLHGGSNEGCITSRWENDYNDHEFDNLTVVDCGKVSTNWSVINGMDNIVNALGRVVLLGAKKTSNWPSWEVSRMQLENIIAYDIYLAIGKKREAKDWFENCLTNTEEISRKKSFWFRDWYYPIYAKYGQNRVLNNFLNILSENWPKDESGFDYAKELNVGEFVHFWSGAAGVNLKDLANKTIGWNSKYERQMENAAMEFPAIKYMGYDYYFAESHSDNNALVIGILVGFAIVLFASIAIPLEFYRRKVNRLKKQIRELTNEEIKEFFEGSGKVNESIGNNACIESQPFNKDYEIPRERLSISLDAVLGSGEFGLVVNGMLKGTAGEEENEVQVAVKTVKPNVDINAFKALLSELKVMSYLGSHPNITSLLGTFTINIKNREVYVALEFCSNGDLLKFLKNHRSRFQDLFGNKAEQNQEQNVKPEYGIQETSFSNSVSVSDVEAITNKSENAPNKLFEFSTLDLINWSKQVANGLIYIASKKVIHGDLAARNILLTANNVAKISDFGLSRQLANYSNYMKTTKTPLPWRWMAIESLRDMQFSVETDIWAFGVTLYEIFSLGTTPYAGWTWDYEFIDKLVAGHRLSTPEFGNEEIFGLMMDCMKKEPNERITFADIFLKLHSMKSKMQHESTSNVNSNYIQFE